MDSTNSASWSCPEPGVRRGLAVLLMYGDFMAPIGPLAAAAHKVFEINVDWREYDRHAG